MVFLYQKYGDHSNRLFQAVNLESFCKYNNIKFYNLDFADMQRIYGIHSKFSFSYINRRFLPPSNIRQFFFKIFNFFINTFFKKWIGNIYYDIDITDNERNLYSSILINKKIVFVKGWRMDFSKYVKIYKEYFQQKYAVKIELSDQYHSILNKFDKYDIKVGIHIRRGDYNNFCGGIYYYEDSIYEKYITDFNKLNFDKKILFILFSNEDITLKLPYDNIISKCKWYEDHTIMSKCDYLIGPPSTFTAWASFIGDVPLYFINNKNEELKMSNFNK